MRYGIHVHFDNLKPYVEAEEDELGTELKECDSNM